MIEKQKLEKLYRSGLSMQEISDKTGYSYHQVTYWMEKYSIPRRSQSEATYVKRNPKGDPFKIKNKLTPKEMKLEGLGLGFYWGEGDRSNGTSIRLSNTDPQLIKKFIEFLIRICGVKREKLKYELTISNDVNKEKAVNFWMNNLDIGRKQFGKIVRIPPQGKGTYRKKSQTQVF